jgi:hypothetical protein
MKRAVGAGNPKSGEKADAGTKLVTIAETNRMPI